MDTQGLSKKRGITLIELTIALAVASVFGAAVFISLRGIDRIALQRASYALQADFRYSQRMAMIEGRRWGILFDVVGNQYHVISTGPTKIEKTVPLPDGVVLIETSAPIMLYLPRGTASAGFRVTLARGAYWQRLTATVSGGRIRIYDMIRVGQAFP